MDQKLDPLSRIMDGLDVETFFLCRDESEARELMLKLLANLGLTDIDIVFIQHEGPGARVRGRAYLRRPGRSNPFPREGQL